MSDTATQTDRSIIEGVLREQRDGAIVLALAGTNYRLRLAVDQPLDEPIGSKVRGWIRARAARIDSIKSGGRYIEPLEGRPRRVQGRVLSVDEVNEELLVLAATRVVCRTDGRQRVTMFEPGQMVSFDVEPGARFEPAP